MTASSSRRGFLRLLGGTVAGAAVLGAAARSGAQEVAAAPAPTDGARTLTFPPGDVTRGTNVPRWVAEGGKRYAATTDGAVEVVWHVDAPQKLIALTFDDGPVPGVSDVLYDSLDEAGIPATLFVVGSRVLRYGDMMRGRIDRHEIANHTFSHDSTFTKTSDEITKDLTDCHRAIGQVLGRESRLFRPPFSHVNGGTLVAAAAMGYDIIMWDSNISYQGDADQIIRGVVETVVPGSIVLGHDATDYLVGIREVPRLARELKAQGYEFVTVSDLQAAGRR